MTTAHSAPPRSKVSAASAGSAHHDHGTLSRECTEHSAAQGQQVGVMGMAGGWQGGGSSQAPKRACLELQQPCGLACIEGAVANAQPEQQAGGAVAGEGKNVGAAACGCGRA